MGARQGEIAREPYRGKAETQSVWRAGDYEWVGEQMHDVIANDEHTVSMLEATARRRGQTFTFRTVEIYHMRDGKIAERCDFFGRYRGDQALLRVMNHAQ